jgi:hypothetical protein
MMASSCAMPAGRAPRGRHAGDDDSAGATVAWVGSAARVGAVRSAGLEVLNSLGPLFVVLFSNGSAGGSGAEMLLGPA